VLEKTFIVCGEDVEGREMPQGCGFCGAKKITRCDGVLGAIWDGATDISICDGGR